MHTIAYIGIGSNLGNRLHNCRAALGHIGQDQMIEVRKVSNWYETAAVQTTGRAGPAQPDFINGVAEVETNLTAEDLLNFLIAVEVKMGRPYPRPKGEPRTIDLDLLLYGSKIIDKDNLSVPHPELAKRLFVLKPLCDIAPDAINPRLGLTARQMARSRADR